MTTTSKRLFAYILSVIGLDRIAHASSSSTLRRSAASTSSSSSTCSTLSASSSSASFMTESTLIVNAETAGMYDEKHIQDAGVTMMAYDAWSVQTFLSTLPKMSLCHLLTTTALKYPKVMQMIATTITTTSSSSSPESAVADSDLRSNHSSSSYVHLSQPSSASSVSYSRELMAIQEQAYAIVHSLEGLRPSEQFAREAEVAQELQRLVRLCTNTLYAAPQGHSLVALIGLLVIARQGLAAPSSEVRNYMFGGSAACLGRLVVLEMEAVLKNYKVNRLVVSKSDQQWPHLLHVLAPPASILASPDSRRQLAWVIRVLEQVCAQMAECDPYWTFAQEYDNVVAIAARNCCL